MTRPIYAEIDHTALTHNLRQMRVRAGDRTLWAVVKANAYGHGLENAVQCFEEADGLATIDMTDAIRARDAGWEKRILLLEGFFDETDLAPLQAYNVETVIHSDWQIDLLERVRVVAIRAHIKLNTGMNRLGFLPSDLPRVKERLAAIDGLEVVDVMTHFANAEIHNPKSPSVAHQLEAFESSGTHAEEGCLANSAALLWHDEALGQAVRAGAVLYGLSPDSSVSPQSLGLIPVMTLRAKIIAVRWIEEGERVGYGSRWAASRPSRIAVVACGYADGYPRTMPDGAPTWVQGQIAPLVGAVSMDMLCIDITDIPEAGVGSMVELWGKHLDVNKVADACGTIGYDILCALARRVPLKNIKEE